MHLERDIFYPIMADSLVRVEIRPFLAFLLSQFHEIVYCMEDCIVSLLLRMFGLKQALSGSS